MDTTFTDSAVSVVLLFKAQLPYPVEQFAESLHSVLRQDHPPHEVIVVDDRGAAAPADFLIGDLEGAAIRHLPGDYANRAAMYNAGISAASGDYLLLLDNDRTCVVLRQSALRTMTMAATREEPAGLVYADYERIAADGTRSDVHLLDWHPGRLRDTFDLGRALLFDLEALRALDGCDEEFNAADLYDLRLRVSEESGVVHIANRYAGSLYAVAEPATEHNVFAYLLADKSAQREMERACTEHLKRIGAYLPPGEFQMAVEYDDEEAAQFEECLASVVTPVNHRPEFIGRAIESVQVQTEQRVEMIVVVNGGEDDPTCAAVREYMEGGSKYDAGKPPVRLIVVDVNNLGLSLNSGLAEARGKYYVQLDSDDRLKPDAVEKVVQVFESDPTIGMVVGSYEVWTLSNSGELTRNAEIPVVTHAEWTDDNGRNNLLRINGAGAPRTAHIRAIAEAGWFGVNDTQYCRNYGEDYDLVLRISEMHAIGRVWDPIYEVIRHSGGTDHAIDQATIDRNDNAKDEMRLEALLRRFALNEEEGRDGEDA